MMEELKTQELKPTGIRPRHVWIQLRIQEIADAMKRYTAANEPIPSEWIEEYNELLNLK